jgi:Zn-dependent peptidase ImmA (M78 family)
MAITRSRAELEAEGILRTFSVDVPVDPVAIARELGLEVFEVDLGDPDLSGMLLKERTAALPRIYLNEGQHPNRQRFTCAHEIGHYVKHTVDGDNDAFEYVDRRSHLSSKGTDPDERWANAFAAALLMPAEYVISNFEHLGQTGMARRLGVSLEAMGHRINNLSAEIPGR